MKIYISLGALKQDDETDLLTTFSQNIVFTGIDERVSIDLGGGLALLSSYNEISTVGTTGDAVTAFDVFQGTRLVVVNNGANDLQLFPAVGDDFGAGVDTAITIAAGELGVFLGRDSINWDVHIAITKRKQNRKLNKELFQKRI